jgi:metal-responsive CopG/Arc/MetJ family transcriptional regulator
MSNVNTGISIRADILQGLDDWADEEYRSRNSLIQQVLADAVRRRRAEQQRRDEIRRVVRGLGGEPASLPVGVSADADLGDD